MKNKKDTVTVGVDFYGNVAHIEIPVSFIQARIDFLRANCGNELSRLESFLGCD
jgi:hypothetical protein